MNKTIWYRFIVEIQNSTPTSNYVLRGDLTTDGGFDALDFAFMRTVLLGIRRIYEPYTYIADVDDDGDADSIDFMLMRQKLMGMIKEFPGGTLYYYVMYKV